MYRAWQKVVGCFFHRRQAQRFYSCYLNQLTAFGDVIRRLTGWVQATSANMLYRG